MQKFQFTFITLCACALMAAIVGCEVSDDSNPRYDTIVPTNGTPYDMKGYLKTRSAEKNLINKALAEFSIEDTDTSKYSQPEVSDKGVEQRLRYAYGNILAGNQQNAINALEPMVGYETNNNEIRFAVFHMLGLAYQRKGEIENCTHHHNAESCIVPFSANAKHQLQDGSKKAIYYYSQALEVMPNNPSTRWLLTICFETLGQEYAADVLRH